MLLTMLFLSRIEFCGNLLQGALVGASPKPDTLKRSQKRLSAAAASHRSCSLNRFPLIAPPPAMESDHRPSPARCNVCSQVFPSKNKAREHSKAMGHFPTDIVRICDECDATFASNADQGEHSVRTGHLKNSYTSAPTASTSANTGNSFVCANCDTSYPNEDILAAVHIHRCACVICSHFAVAASSGRTQAGIPPIRSSDS